MFQPDSPDWISIIDRRVPFRLRDCGGGPTRVTTAINFATSPVDERPIPAKTNLTLPGGTKRDSDNIRGEQDTWQEESQDLFSAPEEQSEDIKPEISTPCLLSLLSNSDNTGISSEVTADLKPFLSLNKAGLEVRPHVFSAGPNAKPYDDPYESHFKSVRGYMDKGDARGKFSASMSLEIGTGGNDGRHELSSTAPTPLAGKSSQESKETESATFSPDSSHSWLGVGPAESFEPLSCQSVSPLLPDRQFYLDEEKKLDEELDKLRQEYRDRRLAIRISKGMDPFVKKNLRNGTSQFAT